MGKNALLPLTESQATPEIKITEVHFKDSENDKVIFRSNSTGPINLKNHSFKDDSTIISIKEDFIINPGQTAQLIFKSQLSTSFPNIYTEKTGLTGTTEQIILLNHNGYILDAVCWASETPTEKEIKDMQTLFQQQGWTSPEPSSCLNSGVIKNGQYIIRTEKSDTNSKNDWQIKGNRINKTSTTPFTQNGNLSGKVFISEILPNPEGTDSGKEWIEICNKDTRKINLGNWKLEYKTNGKPYMFSNESLNQKECKIFKNLQLPNTKNSLKLFDFNGTLISSVEYLEAPSGKTLSLREISNTGNNKYIWSTPATPGTPNPETSRILGTVINQSQDPPEIIIKSNNQTVKISYNTQLFPSQIIKSAFKENTTANCLIETINQTNNLLEFQIFAESLPQKGIIGFNPPILIISLFIGTFILWYLYARTKKSGINKNINQLCQKKRKIQNPVPKV